MAAQLLLSCLVDVSPRAHFLILSTGSLICSIIFSTLQERLFRTPGFQYGAWVALWTYATFACCGYTEWRLCDRSKRRASLQDYAVISLLAASGYCMTNWALRYLSYSTRVVFKACKVLPVMAFGVLVQRKSYSAGEYMACSGLLSGISLFTLGNQASAHGVAPAGVALIGGALACDALAANLEERLFFRRDDPATHPEVAACLSSFAAAYALAAVVITGELRPAVQHARRHREVLPLIFGSALAGYLAMCLVLLLIKHHSATLSEIVKALRRVAQVALSFVLFPQRLNWKHMAGGCLVVASLAAFHRQQQRRRPLPGASAGTGAPWTAQEPAIRPGPAPLARPDDGRDADNGWGVPAGGTAGVTAKLARHSSGELPRLMADGAVQKAGNVPPAGTAEFWLPAAAGSLRRLFPWSRTNARA